MLGDPVESEIRRRFLRARWTNHAIIRLQERFACGIPEFILENADLVGMPNTGMELWEAKHPDGAHLLFCPAEGTIVTVLTRRQVATSMRRETLMLRNALRKIRDGVIDSPRRFAAEILDRSIYLTAKE